MKSYASRNQLAVSQKQVDEALELEWDRRYLTVLGVANKRLYEFRLQTLSSSLDEDKVLHISPLIIVWLMFCPFLNLNSSGCKISHQPLGGPDDENTVAMGIQ